MVEISDFMMHRIFALIIRIAWNHWIDFLHPVDRRYLMYLFSPLTFLYTSLSLSSSCLLPPPLQRRVLRLWLAAQRRGGSSQFDDTEARLQELCSSEGWSVDGSEGEEEEEEEMENSEPLEDSDIQLSDSGRLCARDFLI